MPAKVIVPPEDCLLASFSVLVKLYALDARDKYPLYRGVKLLSGIPVPMLDGRRTAHLTWIVHEQRFRRGGDCWNLEQKSPKLMKWARGICADRFDAQYVQDTFGLSADDYDKLVAGEQAKYQ